MANQFLKVSVSTIRHAMLSWSFNLMKKHKNINEMHVKVLRCVRLSTRRKLSADSSAAWPVLRATQRPSCEKARWRLSCFRNRYRGNTCQGCVDPCRDVSQNLDEISAESRRNLPQISQDIKLVARNLLIRD